MYNDIWEKYDEELWDNWKKEHPMSLKQELNQCKWLLNVINKEIKILEEQNAIS